MASFPKNDSNQGFNTPISNVIQLVPPCHTVMLQKPGQLSTIYSRLSYQPTNLLRVHHRKIIMSQKFFPKYFTHQSERNTSSVVCWFFFGGGDAGWMTSIFSQHFSVTKKTPSFGKGCWCNLFWGHPTRWWEWCAQTAPHTWRPPPRAVVFPGPTRKINGGKKSHKFINPQNTVCDMGRRKNIRATLWNDEVLLGWLNWTV